MQMNEGDRIPVEELQDHPYITEDLMSTPLCPIDIDSFNEDINLSKARQSTFSQSATTMNSRFDDTTIHDTDVILTTKASEQVRILLGQLVNSTAFS